MQAFAVEHTFPLAIVLSFAFGFGARQIGLPPLIGFLIVGFILNVLGVRSNAVIEQIADIGVMLLLFTIGLKLKIKGLLKPEVWGTASAHAAITTLVFTLLLLVLGLTGLPMLGGLSVETALLIAFALSFSSTVFAVKILEDKGEMSSLHARTAIGILIMQDVFAVIFLTASSGKLPSVWALALVGLVLVRPLFFYVLDRVGHGELVPLFGFLAALALGVELFGAVGLKPDLGALVFGMLLAGHKKASEVADSLFAFKEIFLVAFFINIGLADLPTWQTMGIGLLFLLLVPFKGALFFALLTRFRLRGRTAALSSVVLNNYSEFGLIVGAVGVKLGLIGGDVLVAIAIALSLSFVLAAPLATRAQALCTRFNTVLARFETRERHPEESMISTGDARIAIFGMGRIGSGAYQYLQAKHGDVVVGFDVDPAKVADHEQKGRHVILGDATDPHFWQRRGASKIESVLLAMPEHHANMFALRELRSAGFTGYVAALAQFPDRAAALEEAGANVAYSTYAEAGAGFAAHVENELAKAAIVPDSDAPPTSA